MRALVPLQELESKQQEVDKLNETIDHLEEDISQSAVKQEAVALYEKMTLLEEKRSSLVNEMKKKETPQEERERLLKQVKDDNQEIARMENRCLARFLNSLSFIFLILFNKPSINVLFWEYIHSNHTCVIYISWRKRRWQVYCLHRNGGSGCLAQLWVKLYSGR